MTDDSRLTTKRPRSDRCHRGWPRALGRLRRRRHRQRNRGRAVPATGRQRPTLPRHGREPHRLAASRPRRSPLTGTASRCSPSATRRTNRRRRSPRTATSSPSSNSSRARTPSGGRRSEPVPPAQTLTGENREGVEGRATSHPDLAEGGVVTPHPGITGVGDLPEKFDWDEPAASVVVERIA